MKMIKVALVSFALTLVSTTAFAQAPCGPEDWSCGSGRIGLGTDVAIGGDPGLSFRLFPTEQFGLELTFGGHIRSEQTTTFTQVNGFYQKFKTTTTGRRIFLGLLGEFAFAHSDRARMSTYFGFGIDNTGRKNTIPATATTPEVSTSNSDTNFELEFGLRGEVFFYRFFSVFCRVGITIDPLGKMELGPDSDGTETLTPGQPESEYGGVDIGIFDNADLLGTAGFTFWFN